MLFTFISRDKSGSGNDMYFQYEAEDVDKALEEFEKETLGMYEINAFTFED